jgi:hypothetical protein
MCFGCTHSHFWDELSPFFGGEGGEGGEGKRLA